MLALVPLLLALVTRYLGAVWALVGINSILTVVEIAHAHKGKGKDASHTMETGTTEGALSPPVSLELAPRARMHK